MLADALLIVPETKSPSKPLSDFTGPEKVVRAISKPHMRVVFTSLHVVSRVCLVNGFFPITTVYH
jgi:hypothetical protein